MVLGLRVHLFVHLLLGVFFLMPFFLAGPIITATTTTPPAMSVSQRVAYINQDGAVLAGFQGDWL